VHEAGKLCVQSCHLGDSIHVTKTEANYHYRLAFDGESFTTQAYHPACPLRALFEYNGRLFEFQTNEQCTVLRLEYKTLRLKEAPYAEFARDRNELYVLSSNVVVVVDLNRFVVVRTTEGPRQRLAGHALACAMSDTVVLVRDYGELLRLERSHGTWSRDNRLRLMLNDGEWPKDLVATVDSVYCLTDRRLLQLTDNAWRVRLEFAPQPSLVFTMPTQNNKRKRSV
jgi:hypothetical protein